MRIHHAIDECCLPVTKQYKAGAAPCEHECHYSGVGTEGGGGPPIIQQGGPVPPPPQ